MLMWKEHFNWSEMTSVEVLVFPSSHVTLVKEVSYPKPQIFNGNERMKEPISPHYHEG